MVFAECRAGALVIAYVLEPNEAEAQPGRPGPGGAAVVCTASTSLR